MKFLGSIIAYGAMALLIGWGILHAVHGSYWLLIVGTIVYLGMLTKFGCIPPKSH
ncbi:MAG TPA: hypothetical protein VFW05_16810 [Verrucomicrobiae bacterium]|nr:hypothetical protein [Verrucomicrobiae bacterium]